MENKNTIIALVLMMAVWFGFMELFPPEDKQNASSVQPVAVAPVLPVQDKSDATPTVPSAAQSITDFIATSSVESLPVIIDTSLFVVEFNTATASIEKFELKNYTEGPDKTSPLVTLVDKTSRFPGTLSLSGYEGFQLPANVPFTSTLTGKKMSLARGETLEIPFVVKTQQGLLVKKSFVLKGDQYDFNLNVTVENAGGLSSGGYFTLSLLNLWKESYEENSYEFNGPSTLVGEEIDQLKVKDITESDKKYGAEALWSSFQTKYFMNACVPLGNQYESLAVRKDDQLIINTFKTSYASLQPGGKISFDYLLYFGPRDLELLQKSGHNLDKAIDFGFFSVIALPLLKVLQFFYGYIGNYGFAIILLTIIIKALFWPLTQKSYASMKSMQKLQPEMQKLRERFKNDRERMNREIMELYKKHRVNPLGGCLPMLVQIPVFFALYKVLLDTIDLRHAPFALWITDLSAKDPYYVTPVIMGVTMFLQQKMTPSTMDPAQARIFMLMPVVFTFLFLNFPSGLVIYWLVNNILTIAQQFLINRNRSI